jgi:hypothetical protein
MYRFPIYISDRREFNGYKNIKDRVRAFLKRRFVYESDCSGDVWKYKLRYLNIEVEILSANTSRYYEKPVYTPTIKYRFTGVGNWEILPVNLKGSDTEYEAKYEAEFELLMMLAPGLVKEYFPSFEYNKEKEALPN